MRPGGDARLSIGEFYNSFENSFELLAGQPGILGARQRNHA